MNLPHGKARVQGNAGGMDDAPFALGMTPLKKDGVQKAIKGYTSVEEVLSVL